MITFRERVFGLVAPSPGRTKVMITNLKVPAGRTTAGRTTAGRTRASRDGAVRFRREVARRQAQPAQQRKDLFQLAGTVAAHPEPGRHQVLGRLFRDSPATP